MFDLAQLPSVHVCHVRLEMLVIYDTIYLIFLSQKFALDSSGFTETAFPKSWLNLEMKPLNKTKKNDCGVVIFFFFFPVRNRAIADYLRSNGYEEAYSTFKKEAELDMV